jgi:hypothetical protein
MHANGVFSRAKARSEGIVGRSVLKKKSIGLF